MQNQIGMCVHKLIGWSLFCARSAGGSIAGKKMILAWRIIYFTVALYGAGVR